MKTFDRWQPFGKWSWAYRRFLAHHRELSQMYWSHEPRATREFKTLRGHAGSWPPPAWQLSARALKNDVYQNHALFLSANDAFLNWVRLSGVMALSGHLEVFLRECISAALESDPAAPLGATRAVDGVRLLKARPGYNCLEQATHIAEGTWASRLIHYERFFGAVPKELRSHEGALESLRRMRNAVGHHFGRKSEGFDFGIHPRRPAAERVSEDRLFAWMAVADEAAFAINEQLLSHIGDYEMLRYFHHWKKKYKGNFHRERNDFKKELGRLAGPPPGKQYTDDLIEHYASL